MYGIDWLRWHRVFVFDFIVTGIRPKEEITTTTFVTAMLSDRAILRVMEPYEIPVIDRLYDLNEIIYRRFCRITVPGFPNVLRL